MREAGATTLYITHDQVEAFALADRVDVLQRGRLVQVGTPEEIYAEPASPFVARFTGLSGELTVRVFGSVQDGAVVVAPAPLDGQRRAPRRTRVKAAHDLDGPMARMLIRPTGVSPCDAADTDRQLNGFVADVAFRGRGYEHAIDVPGHGRLTSILSRTRASRGAAVGLRLDPAGCHVFPAAEPTQVAGPASADLPLVTESR